MSHTTRIGGWSFSHDGDPRGGNVLVAKLHPTKDDEIIGERFEIPYNVIESFVGCMLMNEHIGRVESIPYHEFLRGQRP